jgi:hypothetical protein
MTLLPYAGGFTYLSNDTHFDISKERFLRIYSDGGDDDDDDDDDDNEDNDDLLLLLLWSF